MLDPVLIWFAPILDGYIPVDIAARLGAQTPDVEKKLGYRTASVASLLRLGV